MAGLADLESAIRWANESRARYHQNLSENAMLATGLGVGLIPLAGAITYQGIAGYPANTIALTSIIGAAALGTGTYLMSPPRQIIYAQAEKAVTCAINAVSPLYFPSDAMQAYQTQVEALGADLLNATTLLPNANLTAPNYAALSDQVQGGTIDYAKARAFLATAGKAAILLISTVDSIRSAVDIQLIQTLPNPQTLADGLGGLIPLKIDPNGFKPTNKTSTGAAIVRTYRSTDPNPQALELVQLIQQERSTLKPVTNVTDNYSVVDALKPCVPDLEKLAIAFKVSPHLDDPLTLKQNDKKVFFLAGGKPPFFAAIAPKAAAGSVTSTIEFRDGAWILTIAADTIASKGDYQLQISDSSQSAPQTATLKVQ